MNLNNQINMNSRYYKWKKGIRECKLEVYIDSHNPPYIHSLIGSYWITLSTISLKVDIKQSNIFYDSMKPTNRFNSSIKT